LEVSRHGRIRKRTGTALLETVRRITSMFGMKTKALLKKYNNLISKILNIPNEVYFTVDSKEIGELTAEKKALLKDWSLGVYTLYKDKKDGKYLNPIASWELYQMPHCCAIAVSCRAFVELQYRSKGLGALLNNLRQEIARLLGYSLLLCTDTSINTHQRQLLATNGWSDICTVFNKRTKNTVYISVIYL